MYTSIHTYVLSSSSVDCSFSHWKAKVKNIVIAPHKQQAKNRTLSKLYLLYTEKTFLIVHVLSQHLGAKRRDEGFGVLPRGPSDAKQICFKERLY